MHQLESVRDIVRGGVFAFAEPGKQGALLRRAPSARNQQLLSSRLGQRPRLPVLQRRLAFPQARRQGRGKHFAQGVMVVVGSPAQQLEGDRIEHGLRVQNVDRRFELAGATSDCAAIPTRMPTSVWRPNGTRTLTPSRSEPTESEPKFAGGR